MPVFCWIISRDASHRLRKPCVMAGLLAELEKCEPSLVTPRTDMPLWHGMLSTFGRDEYTSESPASFGAADSRRT